MNYTDFAIEKTVRLLGIDSPTGYTAEAAAAVKAEFEALGFASHITRKGGVVVDLGGEDSNNALLLQAHLDTLGAMVAEIKSNGRLRLAPLGCLAAVNAAPENVRIITRDGHRFDGTIQPCNASQHVNGELESTKRDYTNIEAVPDEPVSTAEDTRALGIEVGDIVALDPRTCITPSGYIKSRFLDDKLCLGILLGLARWIVDEHITLKRRVYIHITAFEEVGHGGAGSVPPGVTEAISLDMGCVGDGLQGTERTVSICAKDAQGPYHYAVVTRLIEAARAAGAAFAVDVYPHYTSDVETTLTAGNDIAHGLLGPGVYASHSYERSHRAGVENTLKTMQAYLQRL